MAWGAAHALGPGHGKTLVAAYLVGSRGTAGHALLLGLTVTITHTSSVVALGLVTLYASRYIAAEDLYIWLSVLSGALVVAMGALLFNSRLRGLLERRARTRSAIVVAPETASGRRAALKRRRFAAPASHSHDGPGHTHDGHGHSHLATRPGLRGLIALGISGGLLPCPTALVVMLGAIAIERVEYGLALILAFSVGLAGVLTAVGIALVYAGRALSGSRRLSALAGNQLAVNFLQGAPIVSALVILVVGLVLTGNALSDAL